MTRLLAMSLVLALLAGCSSMPSSQRTTALESRAETTFRAGLSQYRQGRYEPAAACFEQALALHASVDDGVGTSRALASLGRAHLALGRHSRATSDFQRALAAARSVQHTPLTAEALGGLAAVALAKGRADDAITWLDAGLQLPLADPGPERAVLLHDLGMAQRDLGQTDAAATTLRRALDMHEALNDHLGVAADCHALAVLAAEAGDVPAALDLARRALSRDKARENPVGVATDLMLLARLQRQGGDLAAAADYYRRAELAWSALGDRDRATAVAELREAFGPGGLAVSR